MDVAQNDYAVIVHNDLKKIMDLWNLDGMIASLCISRVVKYGIKGCYFFYICSELDTSVMRWAHQQPYIEGHLLERIHMNLLSNLSDLQQMNIYLDDHAIDD